MTVKLINHRYTKEMEPEANMAEMNESYYDSHYNYSVFEDYEEVIPSIPTEQLVVPILVYSLTFITGLLGNILILVAVASQKQVKATCQCQESPDIFDKLFISINSRGNLIIYTE